MTVGKVLRLDEANEQDAIARAVSALQAGKLVIIPTDTVYGLAGRMTRETAQRVFELKGRDNTKALPVLVSDLEQLRRIGTDLPQEAEVLARCYWPGPLTIIVHRSEAVPAEIAGGGDTIGVRMPDHPVTLALIRSHGEPIIATSANRSGTPSAVGIDEVDPLLLEAVAVALDAGPCPLRHASTVLDLTVAPFTILRSGPIAQRDLVATLRTDVATAYNAEGDAG